MKVMASVRAETLSEARRHGAHSNIPECCVRFYVENWDRLSAINVRRGLNRDLDVQYVMCTRCLRAYRNGLLKPNVVHVCRDSRDGRLCHRYLSGPDRRAGLPIAKRYVLSHGRLQRIGVGR